MIPQSKIGLYGGSFDPIHHGHLILAREAREQLGLDRVLLIPAGISPHKLEHPPVSVEVRAAMVEASVAGEEGLGWDDFEIRRAGPSFAVDTVRHMRERFPGAEIFYLIGSDNLAALDTWKDIDELRRLARFVVLDRGSPGDSLDFACVRRRVEISSTDIRNRVARGDSIRYLTPDPVCELISRHRLYRND